MSDETDVPAGPSGEAAEQTVSPADWGLDGDRRGLSKETWIGLALIAVLLCAFTFVVYKRTDQARNQQASASTETERSTPPEATAAVTEAEPAPRVQPRSRELGGDSSAHLASAEAESDPPQFDFSGSRSSPPAAESASNQAFLSTPPEFPEETTVRTDNENGGNPFQLGAETSLVPAPSAASSEPAGATESLDELELFPGERALVQQAPAGAADHSLRHGAENSTEQLQLVISDPGNPFAAEAAEPELERPADPRLAQQEPSQPLPLPEDTPVEFLAPAELPDGGAIAIGPAGAEPEQEVAGSTTAVHHPARAPLPITGTQAAQYAEPDDPDRRKRSAVPVSDLQGADELVPEPIDLPFGDPAESRLGPSGDPFASEESSPAPFTAAPGATPVPASSDPIAQKQRPAVYEVRPGDNFWIISRRQYGTARYYMALARYNSQRIPDPQRMRPGMKVLVPTRDVLESQYPDLFAGRSTNRPNYDGTRSDVPAGFHVDASGRPVYRVGSKDTLGEIARRHLGRSSRWIQIYEMNRQAVSSPHDLKVGTILKLPADASRIQTARRER